MHRPPRRRRDKLPIPVTEVQRQWVHHADSSGYPLLVSEHLLANCNRHSYDHAGSSGAKPEGALQDTVFGDLFEFSPFYILVPSRRHVKGPSDPVIDLVLR